MLLDMSFEDDDYVMEVIRDLEDRLYITMTETTTSTAKHKERFDSPKTFNLTQVDV